MKEPVMLRIQSGSASATPAPRLVQRLYASADQALRAKLLHCLLQPLGLLGAMGAAAGAFSEVVLRGGGKVLVVGVEDVAKVSTEQVLELARFAEQVNPELLRQVADLVAQQNVGLAAFSMSAVAMLYRAVGNTRGPRRPDPHANE